MSETALPWYRHGWPWILIAIPAVAVVLGIAMLAIAIGTDDGLVADDYYKRGLAINQTLERVARGEALGLAALVDVTPEGAVALRVIRVNDAAALPPTLQFRLAHPTRAGADRVAVLVRGSDGTYAGRIAPSAAGRWQVIVEAQDWRLPAVPVTGELRGVRLGAGG